MQIAFFAVAKMTKEEREGHPWAKRTCELLFRGDGRNLPGFMVGRQMCVTLCFFIIARVTTLNVEVGTGENIFGVSDGLQTFFNTGLLGALITTIVASITWQLVASAFPMAFLSTPVTYVLLRIALLLEWTGLVSASWVLAMIHKKVAGFKYDEVYVGTAEERAARAKQDGEQNVVPGHMYPGVPILPHGADEHMTEEEMDELEAELLEQQKNVELRLKSLQAKRQRALAGSKDAHEHHTDNGSDEDV